MASAKKSPWRARLRCNRLQWALPLLLIPAALVILWQELAPLARAAPPAPAHAITIAARPADGVGTRIGPFRLMGALVLSSDDPGFGGLSGLAARGDGTLVAVTDAGQWLALTPRLAGGRLAGIAAARTAGFATGATKADLDAEAIVLGADGRTYISLEQRHRILVLAGQSPPFRTDATIFHTAAITWPPNGGGESLALLPGGRMLWLSEDARRPDGLAVALLAAPGQPLRSIGIPVPAGFAPTDMAPLDDRHLIVLHRKFDGTTVEAAITRVDLGPVLVGGSAATMAPLARWGPGGPWPIDNMEGLALVREGTRRVLYLVSDDNFSRAQRTLLLQLAIVSPLAAAQSP